MYIIFIFSQKSLDCFPYTTKARKNSRFRLLGLVNQVLRRILKNYTIVSEFFYLSHAHLVYFSREIYIYKLTFIYFFIHFKIGLTSSTFVKEELILPTNLVKWLCAQDSRATSNLQVPCTVGTTCARIWGSKGDILQIQNV